jgi:oligopeptide/dipeptide ABC transporter ATP-binding protein
MLPTEVIAPDRDAGVSATVRPLLEVRDLVVHFPLPKRTLRGPRPHVRAVDGITFSIDEGEVLGLVGESGSGKSTTGRAILRRHDATAGSVVFDGNDITKLRGRALRRLRRDMQMVFQDPYASLNPRMKVAQIIGEPLRVHSRGSDPAEWEGRVAELLQAVGLGVDHGERYPHALSGGQRQRVGIARALALNPRLIVADEPVSALDVSTQAQIINLLQDLQSERNLTYLFIAHNLAVVRQLASRVAIMYCGKLMELGDRDAVFVEPSHPYTRALLSAVPEIEPHRRSAGRVVLQGDVPDPANPPPGCRFSGRCPSVTERCRIEEPEFREVRPGHWAACHYA